MVSGIIPRVVRKYGVGIWFVIGLALVVMLAIAWPLLTRRTPSEPRA